MNVHKNTSIIGKMICQLAPEFDAVVELDPEWGIDGQIRFANGLTRYFRFSIIDINTIGAAEIAKDKERSLHFLKRLGYSVVEGESFLVHDWALSLASAKSVDSITGYVRQIGYPVVVKPNAGNRGRGVRLATDEESLAQAVRGAASIDRVVLVQKPVAGRDYRIVILDDQVVCAYERRPLSIFGDRRSTIDELVTARLSSLEAIGISLTDDQRQEISRDLDRNGISRATVMALGDELRLLFASNLSSGGSAVDVSDEISDELASVAISISRDMGLRFAGIDLLVQNSISHAPAAYHLLEVNAAPGLDHFANIGVLQTEKVEILCRRLMTIMAQKPC